MFNRNKGQNQDAKKNDAAENAEPAADVKTESAADANAESTADANAESAEAAETEQVSESKATTENTSLTAAFAQWVAEARASKMDFIVFMIQKILQEAAARSASDVHFQPGRLGVEVRFRLDGVLHIAGNLPLANVHQIAARIKVLANLMTYKVDLPQEGRVPKGLVPGVDREIRISSAPALYGERIVARFFSAGNLYQTPDVLGFTQDILEGLMLAITRTSGAILITGPAGSGKTTTTAALLRALVGQKETEGIVRSIVSLEDPVEHAIDGISQMEISQTGETTLDRLLIALMRQDPDVIMVGEIRDRPTAEASMQAALTGHLLLSTFHATDAASAICRFLELGVEPFTLRSSLSYVLCQRLVRRLCPECRKKVESSEPKRIHVINRPKEIHQWYEPVGCEKCNGTGYLGRFLVAESLPLNSEEMADAILERRETSVLQRIGESKGMVPFHELAVRFIEDGTTSPVEVLRVFGG